MILLSNRRIPIQFLAFHVLLLLSFKAKAKCKNGCNLAFASYYAWNGSNLSYISKVFDQQISEILKYNHDQVPDQDTIIAGSRINVPFSCECLNGDFLGHTFTYTTQFGDTYDKIAWTAFANLTTEDWIRRVNIYEATRIPADVAINVTVNCSCGNRDLSKSFGLFATYPLQPHESLSYLADESGVPAHVLEMYNPGYNFSSGTGIMFVPARG